MVRVVVNATDYRDTLSYPNLAATIAHVPTPDDLSDFELTVDLMIEAVRERAGSRMGDSQAPWRRRRDVTT